MSKEKPEKWVQLTKAERQYEHPKTIYKEYMIEQEIGLYCDFLFKEKKDKVIINCVTNIKNAEATDKFIDDWTNELYESQQIPERFEIGEIIITKVEQFTIAQLKRLAGEEWKEKWEEEEWGKHFKVKLELE